MRVVAMLNTEDQNGPNSKIIGVPKDEPRLSEYTAPPPHCQPRCDAQQSPSKLFLAKISCDIRSPA
jgi:hypothetical protein